MSSTNRGAERNPNDYYITPQTHIKLFWEAWKSNHPNFDVKNAMILDPSAGGSPEYPDMPYSKVIQPDVTNTIYNMDIRSDSSAAHKGDYLRTKLMWKPDLIISNPPFNLSLDFVKKSITEIKHSGYVIMLLRLNFFGSGIRWEFLKDNMPLETYVHSRRMGFNPTNSKTDSIEYAHFVWGKSNGQGFTKTYLIR